MRTEKEIKDEIKKFKDMLNQSGVDFQTQTWIQLHLIELRKELKMVKNKM